MIKRCVCICFSLVLTVVFSVGAEEGTSARAARTMSFADHLFESGEYYRAITEYRRYLFEFEDPDQSARARLRIALAYLRGERYGDAREAAQELKRLHPDSLEADSSSLVIAAGYRGEGKDSLAANELDVYALRDIDSAGRQRVAILSAIHYLRAADADAAREMCELVPSGSVIRASADALSADIQSLSSLPRKRPWLAGTLSAVLPGSGQLYVGDRSDALIAFLLNGVLIYASYEAFDNGEHVTGGVLATIETGWYLGNVYNAANGAHKANRLARETFLRNLEVRFRPVWDSGDPGMAIGALFKF